MNQPASEPPQPELTTPAPENGELQHQLLSQVLERLIVLHKESSSDQSDQERINHGMSSQIIGEMTMKACRALIDQEVAELQAHALEEQWDGERLLKEVSALITTITEAMFKEHWFESTLSTSNYPIHSATYGTSMFRYDLRKFMAEDPSVEGFQKFGWIMFDANGLRSFKDCKGHAETTRYLQEVARIFVDPDGPTRKKLAELGINVIPMATGGDEFELYLRGNTPLTPEIINDIVASFQNEISSSETLKIFLNFDDETVLTHYGMPSRKQRREFGKLDPDEKKIQLDEIRAELPDIFKPSFSGGGALLDEGIIKAIEIDDHDLQGIDEDFLTFRAKIVQATLELAEDRQARQKEADMQELKHTDQKQHAFRLRGGLARKLQAEIDRLESVNRRLTGERNKTHDRAKDVISDVPPTL